MMSYVKQTTKICGCPYIHALKKGLEGWKINYQQVSLIEEQVLNI